MEESYNKEPKPTTTKTSTEKSENNPKATPESKVQDGSGIIQDGHQEKSYDKSDGQQEYIDDQQNNLSEE